MRPLTLAAVLMALALPMLLAQQCPPPGPTERDKIELLGLGDRVRASTDALGVPHVSATTLEDAIRVQGYLHARDRFFQMDLRRRQADGRGAELTGNFADLVNLASRTGDVFTRPLGLRAAAERSEALLTTRERDLIQAYADGVNAWLSSSPLPPEYAQLEITGVPQWEVVDTLLIGKGGNAELVGGLVFDAADTAFLESYRAALGEEVGTTLYLEDAARFAPIDPAATVPDAGGALPFAARSPLAARIASATQAGSAEPQPKASGLVTSHSVLRPEGRARFARGSNVWGVAGWQSESGVPLIAGDSHLPLTAPSRSYEMHVTVEDVPGFGPLNVSGMTFAGAPAFISLAQTDHIAWGLTFFAADIADVFADRLVRDAPGCPVALCIASAGMLHPVESRDETYRVNLASNGIPDDLEDQTFLVELLAPQATRVLTVPFRGWGPIVEVADRSVIDDPAPAVTETDVRTIQFTALHGTREAAALFGFLQSRTVAEFREAARFGTALTQHYVVADTAGGLAHLATGEIPLRADLEAGAVFGDLPMFVRDGSGPANWVADPGRSQGQVLPYAIVPWEEMPQVVNPPSGFVVNANNDASGVELDNDLANEFRPSSPGSIYYLGPMYSEGLRAGRITRLLQALVDSGEKVSLEDMKRIQSNTQGLDAEILVPFLLAAWQRATAPGAPALFGPLASDGAVAEAVGRLSAWDYSTPTGIPEGYDAGEVDGQRDAAVPAEEIASSVAATIYAAWRAQLIEDTILPALASVGVQESFTQASLIAIAHLLREDPFTGIGASGVDFFPEPAAQPAAVRRDVVLLGALRGALEVLASNTYASAFGNSTNQDDYRWGRLHRVEFLHPLGGGSSIPPAAGFGDLSPQLRGIARDGGYSTVNIGGAFLNPRAKGANAFVFSTGSEYRHLFAVGDPRARPDGVLGFTNVAGGSSGDPADPLYASQLPQWLTADHHRVPMNRRDVRAVAERVELFIPPLP